MQPTPKSMKTPTHFYQQAKALSRRPTLFAAVALACFATPALADEALTLAAVPIAQPTAVPAIVAQSASPLADALNAIRSGRWDTARAQIEAMSDRSLANYARAELYLAANSPRVEGDALGSLLAEAPNLPQAQRLTALAQRRGMVTTPSLPVEQRLGWAGAAPRRGNPRSIADPALGDLGRTINARIVADDPAGAEALLASASTRLSVATLTEWQYRVAWSYYIENDNVNARRVAAMAQSGGGDWVAQADWAQGLASWRMGDCRTAMAAFRSAAGRTNEAEVEAAGNFWFARAATACGAPQEAQPALRRAAAMDETFYGQLAAESLGIQRGTSFAAVPNDRRVTALPNVRAATALVAAGEMQLADQTLRHQARIGAAADHGALLAIAGSLGLPETQLYLAHNAPSGVRPAGIARYPAPNWAPAGGWEINPALIFAHTLQESQFRTRVVSGAGAVGLMQVRPGTAGDMGLAGGNLTDPSINMAMGQNYIEHLRDNPVTGGLLPKVIAAYNAGPTPLARWNSEIRDNGDPLLFIESIPYWETRAYVGTVLRNMWVYERQLGTVTDSRALMAQGRWPRVPDAPRGARIARAGTGVSGGN